MGFSREARGKCQSVEGEPSRPAQPQLQNCLVEGTVATPTGGLLRSLSWMHSGLSRTLGGSLLPGLLPSLTDHEQARTLGVQLGGGLAWCTLQCPLPQVPGSWMTSCCPGAGWDFPDTEAAWGKVALCPVLATVPHAPDKSPGPAGWCCEREEHGARSTVLTPLDSNVWELHLRVHEGTQCVFHL